MADETKKTRASKEEDAAPARATRAQTAEADVKEAAQPTPTPEPLAPEEATPEEELMRVKSYDAMTLEMAGAPMTARERQLNAPVIGSMPRVRDLDAAGALSELDRWSRGELMIDNRRVGDLVYRYADVVQQDDYVQAARVRSTLVHPIGSDRFVRAIRDMVAAAQG